MFRLMDKVIPASLTNEVFVYLDDLLIVSDIHPQEAKLTINVKKKQFVHQGGKCLGHVIGRATVGTRIKYLQSWSSQAIAP